MLPPATIAARLRAVAPVDVGGSLRRLECPVLALQAEGDWVVPSRAMAAALANRPNTLVKRCPGPHMLLQCNPKAAAREILAFVTGQETAQT